MSLTEEELSLWQRSFEAAESVSLKQWRERGISLIQLVRQQREWLRAKDEAIEDVFRLMDEEILVRNISKDAQHDFVLKSVDLVLRLKNISEASVLGKEDK